MNTPQIFADPTGRRKVLIGFLALGVIVLVRMWNVPRDRRRRFEARFEGRKQHRPAIDPAFNELRIRYARGDIGVEEYAERAHNLGYSLTPETGPAAPAAEEPTQVPPAS